MKEIIELDRELLLYLNGLHTPWLDPVMLFITQTLAWLPLYLLLLYLVYRDYRKDMWIVLLGIVVTLLLTDQITSTIMKPYFARLRPSREPALQGLVHLVDGYTGGKYGFASSHAANTFGAATFFYLLFGRTKKWIAWLFLWAGIMTYSRIYLGVHYPGDILAGGIIGVLAGWTGFKFYQWLMRAMDKRRERSIGP
ncbi:MAG TPA: phosphatase PAP2 family protein [Ohtaekwangia sp.]|nr:phosphatase PAP2 family protein [Ohtaekwangia sp.]